MFKVHPDLLAGAVRRLSDEFRGMCSPQTIQRFVVDSVDELGRTARTERFLPLFGERFARERLRALAKIQGLDMSEVPEVLFVCVHNAGRSQMAAALLDHHAHGRVRVASAGSAPASEVNWTVVAAMQELGLDLSKEFPKPLTDEVTRAADVIVTMGCGDACPVYMGKRYLDWELPDPTGLSVEEVRLIRDDIDRRCRNLMSELFGAAETK
jgi:protein-tyrosine-phosphatase